MAVVEVLGLTEVRQVLVVSEDLDREWGTVEVMPPGLQGVDDGEELLVIDVVIVFCWDEQLGEVGTGVPIAIGIGLEEDGFQSILGGVSDDSEGFGKVREVEDGAR